MIVKAIGSDKEHLTAADRPALEAVKGVGAVLADAFVSYFENENNKEYPYNRNIEDIEFMYGYIVIPRYGIEKIVQNKISNIKEEVLDEITMLVQIPFINEGKIGVIAVNVSLSFRYDKQFKYGDINKSIAECCYFIEKHSKVMNDFYILYSDY